MNKREFLRQLEDALAFELPEGMVRKNYEYYSSYIDNEVRSGRRIGEVMDELGDPGLIARSIIDAAKSGADGIPFTADDRDFRAEAVQAEEAREGVIDSSCGTFDEAGNAACEEPRTTAGGSEYGGSSRGSQWQTQGQTQAGSQQTGGWQPIHMHSYRFGCLTVLLVFFALTVIISTLLTALAPILLPILLVVLIIWFLRSISGGGR